MKLAKKCYDPWVARTRFVPPSNLKLFSLTVILLERPINSFNDVKSWECDVYATFKDDEKAMGLYDDHNKFEKTLDEAVQIRNTPSVFY